MLTLHTLDSAVTFLAVASRAFSRKQDGEGRRGVVLTGGEFGTVSSTLLSLPRKIQQSIYQYSDGPPSSRPYEDLSAAAAGVVGRAEPQVGRRRRKEGGRGSQEQEPQTGDRQLIAMEEVGIA